MSVVRALEWVFVESGLFTSAAYRKDVRQLFLRFQNGDIYRYLECPATVYYEFMAADSKGRFFSRHIRGRFRDERVRRGNPAGGKQETPPSMAEQLAASVLLVKARRGQARNTAQAAGVHEAIR